MFGILGSIDIGSGQQFESFDDLFKDLKAHMSKNGYKVVKSRTHRNKVAGNYEKGSEVVRCDLVCDRGGQPYKCTATQLKTTTKKTNCPWRAKAVNRKTLGAWVLTVICDQHNHEPRTPEPPTDEEDADADGDAEVDTTQGMSMSMSMVGAPVQHANAHAQAPAAADSSAVEPDIVPAADADTSAALAVAGVNPATIRLTGETFHQYKGEYRRMTKPERVGILAQMQLRIAAIYAVENEDLQRQERQARQERKHQEIEENNRRRAVEQQQQQQQQQAQQQQQQHQQAQQQQQQVQQQQQAQAQQQAHQQAQQQQVQQQHQQQVQVQQHQHPHQHPQHQGLPQQHHQHQQHAHQQVAQHHQMAQFAPMGAGGAKHPFQQTAEEEQAQAQERRRHMSQLARDHMGTPVQQSPMQTPMQQMQQAAVQQTPVPVPQFGMQPGPGAQNIFRHYANTPQQGPSPNQTVTPVSVPKRRGRPPKSAAKNANGL